MRESDTSSSLDLEAFVCEVNLTFKEFLPSGLLHKKEEEIGQKFSC
jgi:hypothetical protein